ncbi:phosphate ABC transporter permease subunit PstC [Roseimicrobium sp. ORNL1]|uniref:phosphate ABC transporter permease subunit PstC n=1 Tax=Roseimicrobium sp. ORNL1 TaxID=2711231 RepID=UPI0013E183F9|nr:phosphate ABC transporter permease subunit PstC [Roseimicrobium sp. ORNL1]QIF01321.1 phosphate ABC transporter permease subunit PstC [Roseimicrobium sp. ORNL1]
MVSRWSFTKISTFFFSLIAAGIMVAMLVLLIVQSIPVWKHEGWGFLTGTKWFMRTHEFGAAPMILGTVLVSFTALLLAGPVGIGAAIFTSEFLPSRLRLTVKIIIELLAGVPAVVYGLLGILFLRNWIYDLLTPFDPLSGDTLLTGAVLLAVMILPTVMTLADDALRSVPSAQRTAARGLGLNPTEVVLHVSLPQSARGLLAALLLGLGRALGEAIAVFLVVGRQDNQWPEKLLSINPLIESGQTITTKLASSETNIAYGDPIHWGAICGLALILMLMVAGITLASASLQFFSRNRHAS